MLEIWLSESMENTDGNRIVKPEMTTIMLCFYSRFFIRRRFHASSKVDMEWTENDQRLGILLYTERSDLKFIYRHSCWTILRGKQNFSGLMNMKKNAERREAEEILQSFNFNIMHRACDIMWKCLFFHRSYLHVWDVYDVDIHSIFQRLFIFFLRLLSTIVIFSVASASQLPYWFTAFTVSCRQGKMFSQLLI